MTEQEQIEQMKKELSEAESNEVVEHEDGSLSIALRVPIERQKSRLEAITLRRPTADALAKLDLSSVEKGDMSSCIPFIHAVSDLTAAEVRGLDGADFLFVSTQAIRHFFRRRPRQLARAGR